MLDHTRFDHFGGGIDNTAQDTIRTKPVPLPVVRIHAFQARAFKRSAYLMKIPPRHAVHTADNCGVRSNQGRHLLHDSRNRMCFERDDHIVLRPQILWVVCCCDLRNRLCFIVDQPQPVLLHGCQMRTTGHKADIGPGLRQFHAHEATNCARAEHTNLHRKLLASGIENHLKPRRHRDPDFKTFRRAPTFPPCRSAASCPSPP